MIVSIMIQTRDKVLITHDLPIAVNSNPLKRKTQISPMIRSNIRGTQILPLIMSNMIQTRDDEISNTHDSPIVGSSNAFEVFFKTPTLTEDCTRWDLLYMDLKSQNYHSFLVDVVEKAWEKIHIPIQK
ncbi:hypothetical protein HID58_085947, partial [Brassica napus]